ncbi:hypothetical protein KM043_011744 [Ampulex compressa]|nr:hypothetical protein KM043_011744 [Ampulex compressa]
MLNYTLWFIQIAVLTAQVATKFTANIEASPRVTHIFQDFLNATQAHSASLVIQDRLRTEEPLLNEITRTISRTIPMTSLYFNDSPPTSIPPPVMATSSTLILYIYNSNTPPDSSEIKTITDTMRLLVYNDHRQKILLTIILTSESNDFRKLFEHAWTLHFLDLTILELSITDTSRSSIHIYNPFTRTYGIETYSRNIEWFPYKLKNLHGYPIRVDVLSRPAHSSLKRNSQGYPMRYRGPDARALKIFSQKMNFTVLYYSRLEEFVEMKMANKTILGHMGYLQSGYIQMLATTVPYVSLPSFMNIMRARSVTTERWCPVVPLAYVQQGIDTYQVLALLAFTMAIVTIFWLVCVLMDFQGPLRRPMKIFGSLISVSLPREPRMPAERILFLAVLLVSAIYSSSLHAALMKSNIKGPVQVKYRTVEELLHSGLVAVVHNVLYDFTFSNKKGAFLEFKERAMQVHSMDECVQYLLMHRNVTCFMEESMATAMIYETTHDGKPRMERTDLCYWIPPNGYIFHRYSPYIEPISDMMIRTTESGIRDRWYIDYLGELKPTEADREPEEEDTTKESLKNVLINISCCGCLLGSLVFLGEKGWHVVMNRWKWGRKLIKALRRGCRR